MKLNWLLPLTTFALLGPLVLAPLGCEGGDEGADTADATDGADTTDGGPDLANGQMIHDSSCVIGGCHGSVNVPDLAVEVPMFDDPGLTNQIRNGSMGPAGTMPGFTEAQISADDLDDLIAFLRQMYP